MVAPASTPPSEPRPRLAVNDCVRTEGRNEYSRCGELKQWLLVTMLLPCPLPFPPPAWQPQTVIAPWSPNQGAFPPSTDTAAQPISPGDFCVQVHNLLSGETRSQALASDILARILLKPRLIPATSW